MKAPKVYTIIKHRRGQTTEIDRTLEEFIKYFGYTLEVGESWQHEKGNKKINRQPKSMKSLVSNLNNAVTNAAANGHSDTWYELKVEG
jgi:ribosomal protein L22